MNLNQLTIGKMAKLNHVSEQALRLYDKMGLLTPQVVNPDTGYRYYTIGQSAQLDLIQYYQNIGFSLREIQEELLNGNEAFVHKKLEQRLVDIQNEVLRLKTCSASIHQHLETYNRYTSLPQVGKLFLEYIPERSIIVYDIGTNIFEEDYNHYEYHLRSLKNYLLDINFPMPYFSNAGTIIRNHYLKENTLNSSEIFLITNGTPVNSTLSERIAAGTYLSICGIDFNREKEYAHMLLHEAKENNYHLQGDYYCEVLSESSASHEQKRQFFYKIQIKLCTD